MYGTSMQMKDRRETNVSLCRREGKFPRRSIGQRTVWALLIVVTSPLLDLRLCIGQIEEHVHVQAFVPQSAVEALDVAVLHRLAGTNEIQFHSDLMSPVDHRLASTPARPRVSRAKLDGSGMCTSNVLVISAKPDAWSNDCADELLGA
jgi:hypothetical protein